MRTEGVPSFSESGEIRVHSPPVFVRGARLAREHTLPQIAPEAEQLVLELEAGLRLFERSDVRLHKGAVEKTRDQRGVAGL